MFYKTLPNLFLGDLHSYSIAKDSKEEIKGKQEAAVSQVDI